MRYLGLATILTITVLTISIYTLSFTLITRKIENQADKYAMDVHGNINFEKRTTFLKEQENKIVYTIPGTGIKYTYNQAKQKSLKLGSDLRASTRMRVRIPASTLLKKLVSKNIQDPIFEKALKIAKKENPDEYVESFTKRLIAYYNQLSSTPIYGLFRNSDIQNNLGQNPTEQKLMQAIKQLHKEAVRANVKTYTNRLNKYGTSDVNITITPQQDIEIDAPGHDHTSQQRLKTIIETPGQLAIYSIASLNQAQQKQFIQQLNKEIPNQKKATNNSTTFFFTSEGAILCKKEAIEVLTKALQSDSIKSLLPSNLTPIPSHKPRKERDDHEYYFIYFAQTQKPILQGNEIKHAIKGFSQGEYIVEITTNSIGARKLRKYTAKHTGSKIMIAFDNKAYCVAGVQNEIPNGKCQISGGNMSEQEATDLAKISTSGSLTQTKTIATTTMGPTIGGKALTQGITVFIIALILIMLFMAMYYGVGGIIASLALLANLTITLGVLVQIQTAITLTAIAGIIVAVGMAIDGSVIVIEEILNQQQQGKTLKNAIKHAYKRSSSPIFDSGLSTVLGCCSLNLFGQGPIIGFSTTLMTNTFISCFTVIVLSRVITEGAIRLIGVEKLSFSFLKKYISNV